MRKVTLITLLLVLGAFASANSSFATCWVLDGTFYSENKNDMIRFAKAMQEGDTQTRLEMRNEGRIHRTSKVLAKYLEPGNHVVHVYLYGIGRVWIYHTSLRCK
jgi:hypothetical protein